MSFEFFTQSNINDKEYNVSVVIFNNCLLTTWSPVNKYDFRTLSLDFTFKNNKVDWDLYEILGNKSEHNLIPISFKLFCVKLLDMAAFY